MLKRRNRYLCQVDDEVVFDDFVVLDILLPLGYALEDALRGGGLPVLRLEHPLQGELTRRQLVHRLLLVLHLAHCPRFLSFYSFFS